MPQATVLTETEVKRVFRIIESTRNADRNRAAFALSIYAGMRVGEIAAIKISDVATSEGEIRREIKLSPAQTKGDKGRTVVVSKRAQTELGRYLDKRKPLQPKAPLIPSERGGKSFSNVTLSMLFKHVYQLAGIRTSSHSGRRTYATRLNSQGVGMRTIQQLMGHKHISTTALYCDVSDEMLRQAVELV